MPTVATYNLTGNTYVDGLLGDHKWATTALTFSFPTSGSFYGSGYGSGENTSNFGALNATQQSAVRASLKQYSEVSNLTFTEVAESSTQHGDLRFGLSDKPSTAWAYTPGTRAEGGDSWYNRASGSYNSPQKGNYAFATFLHEIGHALGLEHPHDHIVMPLDRDSMEYTVMTYRSYVGASNTTGYVNESGGYAQSLMMYDIAAIQHMYGANYSTNGGNTTYSWSPTTGEAFVNGVGQGAPAANRIFQTVWDGGGIDTYDFSSYGNALKVDLRPGEWTTTSPVQLAKLHWNGSKAAVGNIANALLHNNDPRSLVENAKGGAGSDTITGNDVANMLWGNAGNDKLYGLAGGDTLIGGQGSDLLDGGTDWDTATFEFGLKEVTVRYGDRALLITRAGEQDTVRSVEAFVFTDGSVVQEDGFTLIDDMFYFTQNHDVYAAGVDAEDHFSQFGWREGRNPNAYFDSWAYLTTYGDVAAAGMDPFFHYNTYGWKEGRDPAANFDTADYLRTYGDVAAAGMNPLAHYLQFGVYEGRMNFDDHAFG